MASYPTPEDMEALTGASSAPPPPARWSPARRAAGAALVVAALATAAVGMALSGGPAAVGAVAMSKSESGTAPQSTAVEVEDHSSVVGSGGTGFANFSGDAAPVRMFTDVEQRVVVRGAEVYSQSVGQAILFTCQPFRTHAVVDQQGTEVQVCGSGLKVTVFERPECAFSEHSVTFGVCVVQGACVMESAATTPWMKMAQSYMVEAC